MSMSMDWLTERRGSPVYDAAGEKIGKIEEIYYDDDSNRPEWVGIGTGFFGTKRVLVPIDGANSFEDGLQIPFSKDYVKDSPDVDEDEIHGARETELYTYYGLTARDTGVAAGRADSPGDVERGNASVTRSEEELRVGKEQVSAGRARLRKWVETEPVQMDVDLQREVARVRRESVDQPVSDAEIGEEDIEVELMREEPVVQKRTVAKERVALDVERETERRTVADEVRKERVDVDDAPER